MRKQISFFMIVWLMSGLVACRQADDTLPVIQFLELNGSVDEHLHGLSGDTLKFHISLTDDQELSQMKVTFTTPAGYHSHDEGTEELNLMEATFQAPNRGAWDTTTIYNLGGLQTERWMNYMVPDTLSGGSSMSISVLDAEGNLAQQDYTIHLSNDNLPDILPDSVSPVPNSDGIVELNTGQPLLLYGNIVDVNDSLEYVKFALLSGTDTVQQNTWTNISNWWFPLQNCIIAPITTAGNYQLYITVADRQGWINWRRVRLIVSS
ncbi:MAG: DUF4625 domain-containing protein [Flavobacteriales bacterium]